MTSSKQPPVTSSVQFTQHEIVHIRSVLSRAKMEENLSSGSKIDDGLRLDIEKGKVCFRCTKTRFNFFNWSYSCRLCQHAFCAACTAKVSFNLESIKLVKLNIITVKPQKL